jgi:curved DNA-binding protein CbpA
MSAPIAGKFQDHYEVLGVETNAEFATIQRVHSELVRKFHPDNLETGDPEKLEAVELAYEVLSQPSLRKEFDKLKGVGEDHSAPKFSGMEFFDAFGRETGLRLALLCVLYDRRRSKPFTPSLSVRHVENILAANNEQLASVLWYLKQRNLVAADDKSSLQITVEGMEYLEKDRPSAETVMPWIKPSGMAAVKAPVAAPASAVPSAPDEDARRSAVNRILGRGPN